MSSSSWFKGIDRTIGDAFTVESGPITEAMLTEAIEHMRSAPPPAPCGSKENPHLTAPVAIGERCRCVRCHAPLVKVSEDRCEYYVPEGTK